MLIAGVALGASAVLASIGLLLTASWLIVRAAQHPPVLYLEVAIVGVRFFGISRSVFRYAERLLTHDVALGDSIEQRVEVYRQLDRVAPAGLQGTTRRGDVVNRVVSDVSTLQDRLLRVRMPWWTGLIAAVAVVVVVGALDPRSGVVVAAGVTTSAIAVRQLVSRRSRRRRGEGAAVGGELAAEVSELVLAAPDLVAFNAQHIATSGSRSATSELADVEGRGAWAASTGSAVVLAVTGLTVAVLAAWSAGVHPVLIGVILLAPVGLAEPMDLWSDAERVRPSVDAATDRLAELARIPTPVEEPPTALDLPSGWGLVVTDLAVGWAGAPVARHIDFAVPEGGAVAISGPSGVGKSTLAYTLLRLLEPLAGSIELGGVDVRRMRSADTRSVIGYLGQDDVVFDTSIRENLRIANPRATDEQLTTALAQAGLADFVAALPAGVDTLVGERGGRLSGGERQRLCLARLLLGSHRILVVDEPTEHLDGPTAATLMDDLIALMPGRSLIVISHASEVLDRFATRIELTSPS